MQPNGNNISVDAQNLKEYISLVIQHTLVNSVRDEVTAFQEAFNSVIPINHFRLFTVEEIADIFGPGAEDWSSKRLSTLSPYGLL